jgi:hypothetical protein
VARCDIIKKCYSRLGCVVSSFLLVRGGALHVRHGEVALHRCIVRRRVPIHHGRCVALSAARPSPGRGGRATRRAAGQADSQDRPTRARAARWGRRPVACACVCVGQREVKAGGHGHAQGGARGGHSRLERGRPRKHPGSVWQKGGCVCERVSRKQGRGFLGAGVKQN